MRSLAVSTLLLASLSLAACATTWKPPAISYDNAPKRATLLPEPPKPVRIVELPKAAALAGPAQTSSRKVEAAARIARPTRACRQGQRRCPRPAEGADFINAIQVYPFADGALYQVYATPGEITDIALQPGETLVGSGPVAAGDTVRWIIGDTESGTGPDKRIHILVKPTRPDLDTNLVINTDRRTYHLELHSTPRPIWRRSPGPMPRTSSSRCASRTRRRTRRRRSMSGVDINALNFRYRIEGDNPPWRPLRAFDDGRQVFIEFPTRHQPGRDAAALGDRRRRRRPAGQLPRQAELHDRRSPVRRRRAQARRQAPAARPHRAHRRKAPIVTDEPRQEERPGAAARPAEEMRLRPRRPPVTRLSRKVLLGLGAAVAVAIGGILLFALRPQQHTTGTELFNTNNRNTPDGLANLPRDYTGLPKPVPKLGPPLPGDLGKPIVNAGAPAPGMSGPEEQRLAQEVEAARTSRLFATTNVTPRSAPPAPAQEAALHAPTRGELRRQPDVTRSQARFPQRLRRSAHDQPRSHPAAGEP